MVFKLQLCPSPNWKHLWMGYAELWLEQEQRSWQSLALLCGLISPTPVFGEINGCYCKQLSFFLKPFLLISYFLDLFCQLFFPLSVVPPILSLCRLIAQWYRMFRTAVSFHTQLFESGIVSRIWLLGPQLPLLMHSLVSFPVLLQGSSSCPLPFSLICLLSVQFSPLAQSWCGQL